MEIRERILQEATRLMAAHGFDGTSLQAVADAVGVKKPSVLYHYPSKEELRRAVLEGVLARWGEVLPRLLMASAQTGLAKFDAVTTELVAFFAADPDRARLLLRELLDRPEGIAAAESQLVRPWVQVVATYVRKGQEAGQIRPEVDPEAYVLHVAGMALSALAVGGALGTTMGGRRRGGVARRMVPELVRMARTSLFTDGYLTHQAAKGAARKPTGADEYGQLLHR